MSNTSFYTSSPYPWLGPFYCIESTGVVVIFELNCPWDANIERSHAYKEEKYSHLVEDLSQRYKTFLFSVEISVRGQAFISSAFKRQEAIKSFFVTCLWQTEKSIQINCSGLLKSSIVGFFFFISARNEPSWSDPSFIMLG